MDMKLVGEICGEPLHLTGSRFFGTANQSSDWDFFIGAKPEVIQWLEANGELLSHTYKTATLVYKVGNLHIQVISNVPAKLAAQEYISSNPELVRALSVSKDAATHIWNYALDKTGDL